MMQKMSNILGYLAAGILAMLVVISPAAQAADPIVISTGKVGLTYHDKYGSGLVLMGKERRVDFKRMPSVGAVENMNRLCQKVAQVTFTQGDAYTVWAGKNPECAVDVYPVGKLPKECVFAAANSKVGDEDDIGAGIRVAVGEDGAGSSESWKNLRTLEKDYAASEMHFVGGARGLSGIQTDSHDMFVWVTSMENAANNKYAQIVNANDDLKWLALDDYNLNNKMPSGEAVYTFEDIVVKKGGWSDTTVTAPCTDTLVLVHSSIDPSVEEFITESLMLNRSRFINGK